MESQFTIQKCSYQQLWPIASKWASFYGYTYGIYDWKPMDSQFVSSAYLGKLNGQIIATIAAPLYENNFAFISIYYVDTKYQKQGFGLKIFSHCMNDLKLCKTIGLQATQSQCQNYAKWGFKNYINHHLFLTKGKKLIKKNQFIVQSTKVSFEQLNLYDKTVFPSKRTKFLKQWIQMPESHSLVFFQNELIKGYGVLRKKVNGYKVGPLYADSCALAGQIFDHLIDFVKQEQQVQIWVPGYHQQGLKMFRQKCGKQQYLSFQMWTNDAPQGSRSMKKYSLTSNQVG